MFLRTYQCSESNEFNVVTKLSYTLITILVTAVLTPNSFGCFFRVLRRYFSRSRNSATSVLVQKCKKKYSIVVQIESNKTDFPHNKSVKIVLPTIKLSIHWDIYIYIYKNISAQLFSTNTFRTNSFSPNTSSLKTLKLSVWS